MPLRRVPIYPPWLHSGTWLSPSMMSISCGWKMRVSKFQDQRFLLLKLWVFALIVQIISANLGQNLQSMGHWTDCVPYLRVHSLWDLLKWLGHLKRSSKGASLYCNRLHESSAKEWSCYGSMHRSRFGLSPGEPWLTRLFTSKVRYIPAIIPRISTPYYLWDFRWLSTDSIWSGT